MHGQLEAGVFPKRLWMIGSKRTAIIQQCRAPQMDERPATTEFH
jgi:hypothetical protein